MINFIISAMIGFASAADAKKDVQEYKAFGKKVLKCLESKDRKCLVALTRKEINFQGMHEFNCEMRMSGKQFVDCIFDSEVKRYDIRKVLRQCLSDPTSKILPSYKTFLTKDSFYCSVDYEDGTLKLENIYLGES